MSAINIKALFSIDADVDMPKYLQVSNSVIRAIEQRKLHKGDQLPSLRQLSGELDISFDTAKKAYDVLKKKNIIVAAHGKSNVVNTSGPLPAYRIFLLFNKLGSHKRIIYDAFTDAFTSHAEIELYVYNNNPHKFRHLVANRRPGYTHHVIIPHLADDPAQIKEMIDEYLTGQHLVILGKQVEGILTPHATVHEDFEHDIYSSLKEALSRLSKYKTLKLVFPEESYYPPEITKGFERFAKNFGFAASIVKGNQTTDDINKGDVFIIITDEDLASVIAACRARKLHIGKDIGIISYNETPLKEVLLDGITTISTDFVKMGRLAAQQVMSNANEQIAVPFKLTLRNSL